MIIFLLKLFSQRFLSLYLNPSNISGTYTKLVHLIIVDLVNVAIEH